jgi:predicted component of type VI protein secretion system
MKAASASHSLSDFLTRYRPALVILSGEARGLEYRLDQPRTALGRGPGVDLALDDASLRTRHALVEYRQGGFVLRQADVDGEAPNAFELKDGDRFQLGSLELQFTLEARD